MCTVLLPLSVNPIAVKHISYHIKRLQEALDKKKIRLGCETRSNLRCCERKTDEQIGLCCDITYSKLKNYEKYSPQQRKIHNQKIYLTFSKTCEGT